MQDVTHLTQTELPPSEGTDDVSRTTVFEAGDTLVIQSRVAGGVSTGWHHNGDRRVFGFVIEGRAQMEYGIEGGESITLSTGDYVYVPPRTVRRVVNSTTEDWVVMICFVGSGPPAISVDGPESASE